MEEYKPNSYRSKEKAAENTERRPKMDKVVDGKVRSKKKTGLRKFADLLIMEDFASMRQYLISDVIVPKTKEIISEGIDRILYGDDGGMRRRSSSKRTPYRSYYEKSGESSRTRRYNPGYEFDDIIFETRGDAEKVLSQMDDIVESYDKVSVADLYDLVGITGNYTDCKYGWTANIRNATATRLYDGTFTIKFPRPTPLD